MRNGGATAREMLIEAAANEWKVPASEVSAASGVLTHRPSGRTTTYGKVAAAAAKLEPPKEVKLKDPKDWKIAGKPLKRLDTPDKVTGKQVYSMDVKLPGMLNAAIKESPVFGGKVKSFDAAKVAGMPGVKKVVQSGDAAVAVIADTWWQAKTALAALPIVWDDGPNAKVSSASIAEMLKAGLDAPEAYVGTRTGDAKDAIAKAAKKVEAVYAYPYQNHATMEPMNATARYTPDKCEVWSSSQNGEAALAAASEASGLPTEKCDFYNTILGGGFGRRAQERVCEPRRADRQGDAGHADQADQVARRRHGERRLSPDHAVQAHWRARRQQRTDRAARAHFRPVDPRRREPARTPGRP